MTAAIYSSRARLDTVVFERNTAGGIMSVTERVENYPGFPEGISGFELAEKMKQQAAQFGAELREITGVLALDQRPDGDWPIVTDEGAVTARAVILSPGVEARKLGVPGEAEFMGRGVSYCATCDGPLYRDKEVVVIGGGNAAVEEGMFLARFAAAVHVVHRRDALRATRIAQERAFAQPNMHFIWNGRVRPHRRRDQGRGHRLRRPARRLAPHAARVGGVLLRRPASQHRLPARRRRARRERLHRDRRATCARAGRGCSPAATRGPGSSSRSPTPSARARWPPSRPRSTSVALDFAATQANAGAVG